MSPSRGGGGGGGNNNYYKACGLALVQLLVLVYLLPFGLTFVPARLALFGRRPDETGLVDVLVVSFFTSPLHPEHYLMVPTTTSTTSTTTVPPVHQQDRQGGTTFRVAGTIDAAAATTTTTTTRLPDLGTALATWDKAIIRPLRMRTILPPYNKSPLSSSSSLSSSLLQLVAVNETTWCFQQDNKDIACRKGLLQGAYHDPTIPTTTSTTATPPPPPLARVFLLVGPSSSSITTTSSSISSTTSTPQNLPPLPAAAIPARGFRKNPHKRQQQQQPLTLSWATTILYPATSQLGFGILAALQGVLFGYYWNYRIPVTSVAKMFANMWQGGEVWRCLSGSTAHFDLWHIGFNMSAFWQLSQVLSQQQQSLLLSFPILYLGLNLGLVVHVSVVWLLWQYGVHVHRNNSASANLSTVPTVGYSGVLFALTTLVVLQQPQSCPIPFVESLCFSTYHLWGGLPVNLAPFVQLGMVQVILPRVSFAGHLAGIIVGFAYTWSSVVAPSLISLWLYHPSLVWPFWHLVYLMGIVPLVIFNNNSSSTGRRLGDGRSRVATLWNAPGLRIALPVFGFSVYAFGLTHPLVWGYAFVLVFWSQSMIAVDNSALVWKRAFGVYALILLMTQAATLSAWILLPTIWLTTRGVVAIGLQALTLWSGLFWILDDVRHGEGIFYYTVGCTILQPLIQVQSTWRTFRRETESTVRPFPGEGRTLRGHAETEMV